MEMTLLIGAGTQVSYIFSKVVTLVEVKEPVSDTRITMNFFLKM